MEFTWAVLLDYLKFASKRDHHDAPFLYLEDEAAISVDGELTKDSVEEFLKQNE